MPVNKVSATVSQADLQAISDAITTISTKLPFLISLPAEERRSMAKMGDKSRAFVSKALELATQNPEILPGNLSVAEFKKDADLFSQLYTIIQPLTLLVDKINDTQMEAGSEAHAAALIVYQTAKISGTGVGGLDSVLDDLGRRFSRKVTTAKDPA